jgi:crotonobetainyl-CoA:carnitine CoA-transferase CaiB-like acyl-CoA transferase
LTDKYFEYTNSLFDHAGIANKKEALKGIRVLDLSRVIYGPVVTKWLGLFGAEIIKVEEPEEGDNWRTGTYWAKYWKDSCPYFQSLNPNKYFVAIDLKAPKGKELILELAKQSDVVVENFRAGLVEAWGIGYTAVSKINPKVIYISCCGYGQYGPLKFFPSWDLIAQSMSGVARLTGFPDHDTYKLPDYYGDFFPGICGAMGVMAALNYRERTGKGQLIDMAQAEALMRTMHNWSYISMTGKDLERTGNQDPTMVPSGIFKTKDEKFTGISIANDKQLTVLLKAMGRSELKQEGKFNDTFKRLQDGSAEVINRAVEEWARCHTLDEIIRSAQEYGFPAAEVKDDWQLTNDEWRRERGSVVEFNDHMYGKGIWPGVPVAMEKTPGRMKRITRPIGYHNRYILKKLLGYSEDELKKLEREKIIGYWANRVGERPPSYYDMENDPVFNYSEGAIDD